MTDLPSTCVSDVCACGSELAVSAPTTAEVLGLVEPWRAFHWAPGHYVPAPSADAP